MDYFKVFPLKFFPPTALKSKISPSSFSVLGQFVRRKECAILSVDQQEEEYEIPNWWVQESHAYWVNMGWFYRLCDHYYDVVTYFYLNSWFTILPYSSLFWIFNSISSVYNSSVSYNDSLNLTTKHKLLSKALTHSATIKLSKKKLTNLLREKGIN